MIPEYLVVEGLYSYRTRTTIDFTRLIGARLFGIFGPVGSGKSTLIEAMSIAIYGDTTRLNARGDNRVYNLLNLRSDRLWIDFVFSLGDHGRYRFTAEAKRRSTDFESVGTLERSAYRWSDEEWIPLESVAGERVLGMSYDNFRRTVIIPQGHFQEFLQLKPAERTKMLKELFSLERFDLYRNAKTLFETARNRIETIDALLAEIPSDLEAALQEIDGAIKTNNKRRSVLISTREEATQRHDRLQALVELVRNRSLLEKRVVGFEGRAEEIDARRAQVVTLERVRDNLLVPYREMQRANELVDAAVTRKKETESALEPIRQKRIQIEERRTALVEQERGRPAMETRRNALSIFLEIAKITAELATVEVDFSEADAVNTKIQTTLAELTQRSDSLVAQRDAIQEDLPSTDAIRRSEQLLQEKKRVDEAGAALSAIEGRITVLEAEWGITEDRLDRPTRRSAVSDTAHELLRRINTTYDVVRQRSESEELGAHLAQVGANLEPGKPCPVCGSTDHPAPFTKPVQATTISETRGELERLAARCEFVVDGLPGEEEEVESLEFTEETIASWWEAHRRLTEVNREIAETQRQRDELYRRNGEVTSRRAEAEGRRRELSRRVDTLSAQIPNGFEAPLSPEEIQGEISTIDATLTTLQDELATVQGAYDDLVQEESRLAAIAAERSETVDRAVEDRERAIDRVRTALASESIAGLESITEETLPALVADLPQISEMRQEIDAFDREYRETQYELTRVTRRIEDHNTEDLPLTGSESIDERLTATIQEIEATDHTIQRVDTEIGELQNRRASTEKDLNRRTSLLQEHRSVADRKENLSTLVRLFEGSRFVRYVSQVFLAQLVAVANARFRRLTRNRLELALRDDQEFEVVDYLNDGRRRSVKTLSGGQTFQAALCLALALVDSVDKKATGDQPGFFFLDEGFGSLDEASLREVFATLNDLRKENRIVGVISHVESLKEEIETYLEVSVDEVQGSTIR